ncbi:hypothetical protein ABIF20_002743 [Bradyrhizobium japonicum]
MQNKAWLLCRCGTGLVAASKRDASHGPVLVSSLSKEARESDMDACWFLAEIVKVFWSDRHKRLRKGRPSVPQVPPPLKCDDME